MEKNINQWKLDTAVVEHSIHHKTEPHLNNIVNWVFIQVFWFYDSEADLFLNRWHTAAWTSLERHVILKQLKFRLGYFIFDAWMILETF